MNIQIETPGDESYDALHERLVALNRDQAAWGTSAFTVVVKDDDGRLIGGARGVVNMGLVEVRGLWLDPKRRQSGLGRDVMTALERHACTLGAKRAALWTYEWQARGFYEKLGYTVFGTLSYPAGPNRYFMQKDLVAD